MRGIFQATFLKSLFQHLGGDATDYFDLIAGTSTGAIVGGCAAFKVDMSIVIQLFRSDGPTIFKKRRAATIRRGPRYSPALLRTTLEKHLGGQQMAQAKVPLLIPVALLDRFGHDVFSSKSTPNMLVTEAILCSSAAPTYFPPVTPTRSERSFVDGGMWANNPVLAAVMHAVHKYGVNRSDIRVLMVGNGRFPAGTKPQQLLRARPYSKEGIGAVFDLMFAAQETAAQQYVEYLVDPGQVISINAQLPVVISLDDVAEAIDRLPPLAEQEAVTMYEVLRPLLAAAPATLATAPTAPEELARAAEELSTRLRINMIQSQWVQREEEAVALTAPSAGDRAILTADNDKIYRCDITTKRVGNVCRNETTIGFSLEGFIPTSEVDFEYILGPGLLNDEAYQQLADGITLQNLQQYIGVDSVTFRNGAETIRYEDLDVRQGKGFFVFAFRCPKGFTAFSEYTELELHMRTFVSRDHAWYTYLTTNTITDKLTVSFEAPFKVTAKQHVSRDAKLQENHRLARAYYSAVTVDGPVPPGSTIDWIFER